MAKAKTAKINVSEMTKDVFITKMNQGIITNKNNADLLNQLLRYKQCKGLDNLDLWRFKIDSLISMGLDLDEIDALKKVVSSEIRKEKNALRKANLEVINTSLEVHQGIRKLKYCQNGSELGIDATPQEYTNYYLTSIRDAIDQGSDLHFPNLTGNVFFLINHKNEKADNLLGLACLAGDYQIVHHIVNHGAKVNGEKLISQNQQIINLLQGLGAEVQRPKRTRTDTDSSVGSAPETNPEFRVAGAVAQAVSGYDHSL